MITVKLCAFSDEADASLEGQIDALKRNNVPYMEMRNVNGKNVTEFTLEEAKAVRATLDENGIKVWSIGSPIGKVDINTDFDEYLKLVRHTCELANILGVHLEGRYLNPDMKGAHSIELIALPTAEDAELLASTMMPPPMHFSLAPEMEGAHDFIKKAVSLGATVGIAHTNATYEEAREAISIGASAFTHTFNAMTKVHHRMPGAAVCSLVSDDAYSEIIPDGQHAHPAMVNLAYKSKPSDKLVLITDSLAATDQPDGEYGVAGSPFFVKDGLARLADGTIAGSTLTMFGALKNMMKFCSISLNEAIKYATVNPASMVKANGVGRLEKCYRADFIVLDNVDDIEINKVYVGGIEVK